jgi:hypothetical protein
MSRRALLVLGCPALAVVVAVSAAGCGRGGAGPPSTGVVDTFSLTRDDCVAPDRTPGDRYHEVGCGEEAATARVVERSEDVPGLAGALATPDCPGGTDLVLDVSRSLTGRAGGGPSRGFACLRNLRPPHPGDPGEGGGPGLVEGDCLALAGPADGDDVRETRCDGTGEAPPDHRVDLVGVAVCPPGTDLALTRSRGLDLDPLHRHAICATALTPGARAADEARDARGGTGGPGGPGGLPSPGDLVSRVPRPPLPSLPPAPPGG